jgi:transcriptional regulator with XRE-family HTH domain
MARIIDGEQMNMIGNRVKQFRKVKKMSQQTLSNKLELLGVYVCRGSISRIEDCSRTVTDIELFALATVLGVSVNDLFDTTGFEHFLE